MSDFTHDFWSIFITVVSVIGILGCFAMLIITSRVKVKASEDGTTGHVFDEDIREMNNPLPLWWMGLFIITIIFAIAYLVAYPGFGSYKGSLHWTQEKAFEEEVKEANAKLASTYSAFASTPIEQLANNQKAMTVGKNIFLNNCAQCHGSDAKGAKGFPNLTDHDWLYGGTPEKIVETITKGRIGVMTPMKDAVGTPEDVKNLANYVLSLSGAPHDSVRAALGKPKFGVCAACHGADAKGNQDIGSPNLTDDIWLHGWGEKAIIEMINNGKQNQMPAQEGRLTPEQIHVVAAYVWSLSNTKNAMAK